MGTIVAIGGGSILKKETLAIDRAIIRLSGKKHPRVLFIPTASDDAPTYMEAMEMYYGKFLGCTFDTLLVATGKPPHEEIRRKIEHADIIYVGGGNTLKMMRRWRRLGIDRLLKLAHKKGTVLCGVSAGSICWFEAGHSDSLSFYNPKRWSYIKVKGLGLIKGIHCPHYDSATLGIKRKTHFQNMMAHTAGTGIAVDNNCALVVHDNRFSVISTKKNAAVYRVTRKGSQRIAATTPRPIDGLYR